MLKNMRLLIQPHKNQFLLAIVSAITMDAVITLINPLSDCLSP
jgi:hypothetical protein